MEWCYLTVEPSCSSLTICGFFKIFMFSVHITILGTVWYLNCIFFLPCVLAFLSKVNISTYNNKHSVFSYRHKCIIATNSSCYEWLCTGASRSGWNKKSTTYLSMRQLHKNNKNTGLCFVHAKHFNSLLGFYSLACRVEKAINLSLFVFYRWKWFANVAKHKIENFDLIF